MQLKLGLLSMNYNVFILNFLCFNSYSDAHTFFLHNLIWISFNLCFTLNTLEKLLNKSHYIRLNMTLHLSEYIKIMLILEPFINQTKSLILKQVFDVR